MKERVLLVDDEAPLLEALRYSLEAEGFVVTTAANGARALGLITEPPPDVIVLDVMLPDTDGFDLCRRMREQHFTGPILLLTAKDREVDVVVGLEVGADDYITKPFRTAELIARIRAHLRRERRGHDAPAQLRFHDLTIDPQRREAWLRNRLLNLTPREFDTLLELASHRDRALSREQLLERIWGYDFEGGTHVVTSTVQRLRDKIEEVPGRPRFIVSVRGVGYRFDGGR